MKKNIFLIFFLLLTGVCITKAQTFSIKGKVVDAASKKAIPYVTVLIKGNTEKETVTDDNGNFQLNNLPLGEYEINISCMGYLTYSKKIGKTSGILDLGNILLSFDVKEIGEVDVNGRAPIAIQKSDTVQFNSTAFKTNTDASAEDLIKKMPGITVQSNNTVQAQGENVQKVTVDGKPFFDQDPSLAIKSLPAEIIDKIQVFDDQSDQAKFTGFDDGQTSKTINFITKKDKRNGQFGKIFAGYGNDGKYQAAGTLNIFSGNSRYSIIAQSNDVNQQNFSNEDLLGVIGSSGRSGGQGFGMRAAGSGPGTGSGGSQGSSPNFRNPAISDFIVGQQPGISKTNAIGLNYSGKWGDKINVTGSYFFNKSDNQTNQQTLDKFYSGKDSGEVRNITSNSPSTNFNHRFHLKLEYNIDTANKITIQPRLSLQANNSSSEMITQTITNKNDTSKSVNNLNTDVNGYNFSNDILFMHKFNKKGRTLSLDINTSLNSKTGESHLAYKDTSSTNQLSNLSVKNNTIGLNIVYTEPLGLKNQLMANYNISNNRNNSDKQTDTITQAYKNFDTSLSNKFNSAYFTEKAGVGFRRKGSNYFLMAGVNYQYSKLNDDAMFPAKSTIFYPFNKFLPLARFRYDISKSTNLNIFYRTNITPPAINQLQNVYDNSNPNQITIGNPDLKADYEQNLFIRFSSTNTSKSSTVFVLLSGSTINNYFANNITDFKGKKDSTINKSIPLSPGSQIIKPVNMNGYYSLNFFTTYGFPVSLIKCNLNFNLSYNYTHTPGIIDSASNYLNNHVMGLGLVIGSNISEKVDFTLSTTGAYNIAENSNNKSSDQKYFNQVSNFSVNLVFLSRLVFNSQLSYQFNRGLGEAFDKDYYLWNMSLAAKLFKNKQGELKFSVYDALNQDQSLKYTPYNNYTESTLSNVLRRYVMATFTYTLRKYKSA